jgi:hypothetical protein
VRDKISQEEIRSASGELAGMTRILYGNATQTLPHGQPGNGWVREQQQWLAGEARFVTTSQVTYDPHGNPQTSVTNGVESRLDYDLYGLFALEERQAAAPGRELIWSATWNPTLGTLATLTDPNAHTAAVLYDSLGRILGIANDGQPEHRGVDYDLSPPFPKITVRDFDGAAADVGARPSQWSPASAGQEAQFAQTAKLIEGLPGRIDAIRSAGVTKEMAQQWTQLYREVASACTTHAGYCRPSIRGRL